MTSVGENKTDEVGYSKQPGKPPGHFKEAMSRVHGRHPRRCSGSLCIGNMRWDRKSEALRFDLNTVNKLPLARSFQGIKKKTQGVQEFSGVSCRNDNLS